MDAGKALRDARQRAKLTQRDLAALTGIPQPAISRIESARVVPLVDTLDKLLRPCGEQLATLPCERYEVDMELMRRLLAMTPKERLERLVAEVNSIHQITRPRARRRLHKRRSGRLTSAT